MCLIDYTPNLGCIALISACKVMDMDLFRTAQPQCIDCSYNKRYRIQFLVNGMMPSMCFERLTWQLFNQLVLFCFSPVKTTWQHDSSPYDICMDQDSDIERRHSIFFFFLGGGCCHRHRHSGLPLVLSLTSWRVYVYVYIQHVTTMVCVARVYICGCRVWWC